MTLEESGVNAAPMQKRPCPCDTVILTAGCAKYRYNKLRLRGIDGIPRVLDSGQCKDSYSIAATAIKLKELFDLQDINELPV
jgi:hydroxylamine reductase